MAGNTNLGKAKDNKNDEFYTQLSDIENELQHYKDHFKDKVVLCNCDDPYESNFFKYFILNFNYLGLKKLITTCYSTSPIAGTQISIFDEPEPTAKQPYKVIIEHVEDLTGNGAIDLDDIQLLLKMPGVVQTLEGDGDFRSSECIELLKEADIVVTNPPFSLFREYVGQLFEYKKQFLIIGSQNAITYKEIFPLIKTNQLWLGLTHPKIFTKPDFSTQTFGNINWWTNLDFNKRHEEIELYKRYRKHESEYPNYANFDAIEVSKVSEIPYDYDGNMGVPISFLDKFCPTQFEILGLTSVRETMPTPVMLGNDFVDHYKAQGGTGHFSPNMYGVYFYEADGTVKKPYGRIIIRRKD